MRGQPLPETSNWVKQDKMSEITLPRLCGEGELPSRFVIKFIMSFAKKHFSAPVLFGAVSLLLLAGCGSGNAKISGRITFPDGKPLTKGVVIFQSATNVAKGMLDADGRYVIGSQYAADGLPPGTYKVFIALASELDPTFVPPSNDPDALRYISLVAERFCSEQTTPLSGEVTRSATMDFTVEAP